MLLCTSHEWREADRTAQQPYELAAPHRVPQLKKTAYYTTPHVAYGSNRFTFAMSALGPLSTPLATKPHTSRHFRDQRGRCNSDL